MKHIFRNILAYIPTSLRIIVTVLPQKGVWRAVLNRQPWLLDILQGRPPYGPEPDAKVASDPTTIHQLLAVEQTTDAKLAAKLPHAIKRAARDVTNGEKQRYSYEEWVEFTRLIRFTVDERQDDDEQEDQRDMVEWDWIGQDSPMMANTSEAEFALDRLCESLSRYVRRVEKTLASTGNGNNLKVAVDADNDSSVVAITQTTSASA